MSDLIPTAHGAQNNVDLDAFLGSGKPADKSVLLNSILHYRELLLRGWWILLLTFGIALGIGAWYLFEKHPKYQSEGLIMVAGKVSLPDGAIYSEELSNFFGTQIELMKSEAVRTRALSRLEAQHPELKPVDAKLVVGQQPNASIFGLSVTSDEPAYSQAYLDATMQAYMDIKREMRSDTSESTLSALTAELANLEKTLKTEDDAILAFKKDNNIGYLQDEGNAAGTYLAGLERKLASLKTEYDLLNRLSVDQNIDRREQISLPDDAADADQTAGTAQVGAAADYMKARQQIELLKARLADYSVDMRPQHPFIVELNRELALYQRLIATYSEQSAEQLAGEKESFRVQIENLESQITEWQAKALDSSERLGRYEKLQGDWDRTKALYDRLLTSMQSVDVNKNIDQDMVSILESATASHPVKLGVPEVIAAACMAGLVIGVGIILLMDQLSDRMKTTASFMAHFSERILGQIGEESGNSAVLAQDDPRHLLVESFSHLRSALTFLPYYKSGRPKTLLVTSAVPSEGKSTVASNLAVTLAAGGTRVLLVDADLRRGRIAQAFNLQYGNQRGFSSVLTGEMNAHDTILTSDYPYLDIIPRGRNLPQPSRYLVGPVMDAFLAQMTSQYDFVIFDSCPVLVADDTTSFAPKVDATLFVVRMSLSSARSSRKALEFLYNRQVNVLGVVLNGVTATGGEHGYYEYSDYHDKPSVTAVATS
jgi:capsular exopolysaccharide synthesis family protein